MAILYFKIHQMHFSLLVPIKKIGIKREHLIKQGYLVYLVKYTGGLGIPSNISDSESSTFYLSIKRVQQHRLKTVIQIFNSSPCSLSLGSFGYGTSSPIVDGSLTHCQRNIQTTLLNYFFGPIFMLPLLSGSIMDL